MLILASKSPRRRELLGMFTKNFKVEAASGDERAHTGEMAGGYAEALARDKAEELARKYPDDIVIGADTVVVCDGEIMGKPTDAADARRMLSMLSGRSHTVCTGIAVCRGGTTHSSFEETQVFMRGVSASEIDAYIATGEPMDKAGAYGIQGIAAAFIERIEGDYFNVVGLPICRLNALLSKFQTSLLERS